LAKRVFKKEAKTGKKAKARDNIILQTENGNVFSILKRKVKFWYNSI